MAGYGDELRIERERHGISLEALSAETKINRKYLLSLESGKYQELPGGIHRRGMVRAYLKAVNLDEQMWLPRFDRSAAEQARMLGLNVEAEQGGWVEFASNVKKNRSAGRQPRDWRWFGVALLVGILCASAWLLWRFEMVKLMK